MVKSRSGLGRGLESLLGGGFDSSLTNSEETRRIETSGADEQGSTAQKQDENSKENIGSSNAQTEDNDIYVNKEDKLTIKSVVERKADENKPDGEIYINLIEPNPDQPRTNFKEEELEELAESIRKNGLLQPILVRRVGSKYQIIAGERRWQACKRVGMSTVPVVIKDADDDESIILALIENIQRSNLNPIEEAYGYRRMMERGKMTQSEVAQAVSKGRTTITNALRLLELPEEAQQLLFEEKITAGHARAILSIPSKEGRKKLTDKLIEEKLSVRDAERIARLLAGKNEKNSQTKKSATPKSFKTVARALSEAFATEVKIRSVGGKNKIEVLFKDEEDLERLFRLITEKEEK